MKQKKNNQIVCFSKGTKVLLGNGTEQHIESINVGDEILNYNTATGKVETTIVEKIASSYHSVVNVITFSNGTTIESTTDHPYFVVDKGWASVNPKMTNDNYTLNVQELQTGDKCLHFNNNVVTEVAIADIGTKVGDQKMYVISGGKNNSFFANGIVVSDENLMTLNLENTNAEFSELNLL
jgi:hypothetical protein